MPYRCIHIGCGGFGGAWCKQFLPANVKDGLIEVVAAVDCNPDAFASAREGLRLRDDQLFTDIRTAMATVKADFCTVVIPPAFHEGVVNLALEHDLHILSEKPIADTLEASQRIARKVKDAGKKMGVTMSHRFRQDITTLRQLIWSGDCGDLDYLVCRFTCDNRAFGSWGHFRHRISDTLLIEGSVHHLDLLADMASLGSDAKCDTVYAQTWNPKWGQYAGNSQALITMRMRNDKRVMYEGAKSNAVGLNWWGEEYIRAECEKATLIMSHARIERFDHDDNAPRQNAIEGTGSPVTLLEQPKWANAWLIEKFVRWLDGGEKMETNVWDNLQSIALVFAGIESGKTGRAVDVQPLLADSADAV